jgi:hypothetical protein
MTLTRRQEKFIEKMIELKHEYASPIHYSVLAERLGVSPFTAYDMLCLLEEKGYVTSEYHLPADKCGPGRAERLFYPSEMAQAFHKQLIGQIGGEGLAFDSLKNLALEKFRTGDFYDLELTEQMMARLLPEGQGEMRYCVEVMTVAALRLKDSPDGRVLYEHLAELLPVEATENGSFPDGSENRKVGLCLLGGFVYSLLVQHYPNSPEWLDKFHQQLQGYLGLVIRMTPVECTRLAGQLHRVLALLIENDKNGIFAKNEYVQK